MKTIFLIIFFISLAGINVNAQEGISDQQTQESISAHNAKSTSANFYLAQQRKEYWQIHAENFYRRARLNKNIAFGLMAVNSTFYVVMHHRISFGDYETDDPKQSFKNLNVLFGVLTGTSLVFYLVGNSAQYQADRIINQDSFSLQINENGIGIAYKF